MNEQEAIERVGKLRDEDLWERALQLEVDERRALEEVAGEFGS